MAKSAMITVAEVLPEWANSALDTLGKREQGLLPSGGRGGRMLFEIAVCQIRAVRYNEFTSRAASW